MIPFNILQCFHCIDLVWWTLYFCNLLSGVKALKNRKDIMRGCFKRTKTLIGFIIKIHHVTMWNTCRPISLHKNRSKLRPLSKPKWDKNDGILPSRSTCLSSFHSQANQSKQSNQACPHLRRREFDFSCADESEKMNILVKNSVRFNIGTQR